MSYSRYPCKILRCCSNWRIGWVRSCDNDGSWKSSFHAIHPSASESLVPPFSWFSGFSHLGESLFDLVFNTEFHEGVILIIPSVFQSIIRVGGFNDTGTFIDHPPKEFLTGMLGFVRKDCGEEFPWKGIDSDQSRYSGRRFSYSLFFECWAGCGKISIASLFENLSVLNASQTRCSPLTGKLPFSRPLPTGRQAFPALLPYSIQTKEKRIGTRPTPFSLTERVTGIEPVA